MHIPKSQNCSMIQSRARLYGPHSSGSSPLLSADGTTFITDGDKIINRCRWTEHFNKILNQPSSINDEAISISHLPQIEVNSSLAKGPTFEETEEAINLLSNRKAPEVMQSLLKL